MSLLRFGPFELDPQREELRRSGLTLRLPRQPFRILLLLVNRAGAVVTREEIQTEIWGSETFVDYEQGINSAIRQIRFVLADNAEAPRYIRTLPRRGYSFIAPVEQVADPLAVDRLPLAEDLAPADGERQTANGVPWQAILGGALTVIAIALLVLTLTLTPRPSPEPPAISRKVIAVQPFRVIGSVPDGIDPRAFTEEMRATMDELPRRYVGVLDPRGAGPANITITGTIQVVPEGTRVIVSASDSLSHTRLWSETYDRPAQRTTGMAVETAHRVMQSIAKRYLPPPRHEARLTTKVSPRAMSLYRRARIERTRMMQPSDWTIARNFFEAALREEPRFAEAWSGLADLWGGRMLVGDRSQSAEYTRRALDCAQRALALQPDNAEAHSLLGVVAFQREYNLSTAEVMFRRATVDDPVYVDAHFNLALVLIARGQFEESVREFHTAQELDPVEYDLHPLMAQLYLYARRYDDAVAVYRDVLAVQPESTYMKLGIVSAYLAERNWPAAIEAARALLEPSQRIDVPPTEEGFLRLYRKLEPSIVNTFGRGPAGDYRLATYYAELGDSDRALEFLGRALDRRAPSLCYILVDPRLDALRGDPRFRALVGRAGMGR